MQPNNTHNPGAARNYPFSALVGQDEMKRALLLCAVDPTLGGVLLSGEKGTAKSTAARALAALLPPMIDAPRPVPDSPLPAGSAPGPGIRPTPFVELPLGATEDRVLGSLDLGAAITQGKVLYKPGLLAAAHQGMLYIDEVNLLPAHLVHLVLDAAASGRAHIEREGISHEHPARFALIASMNPEEGPLGPQLTDRFGLCVQVQGEQDPALRREVLIRRLAYEADPQGFCLRWAPDEAELRQRVSRARARLADTRLSDGAKEQAARLAAQAGTLGQRAELAMARAARAMAALRGLDLAGAELVDETAHMALEHRRPARPRDEVIPSARVVDGPRARPKGPAAQGGAPGAG
jgi:Mg-chelatase subunit ChlI